jgi:hypothetical protein
MKYNDVRQDTVGATRNFGIPGAYTDLADFKDSTSRSNARSGGSREDNGNSKMFTITIDPQRLYTLGVSSFSLADVTLGIREGAFGEGTEFMSPDGRVRIMGGKLRYTRNKALYKLPELRV